jgi:hypothetical protein
MSSQSLLVENTPVVDPSSPGELGKPGTGYRVDVAGLGIGVRHRRGLSLLRADRVLESGEFGLLRGAAPFRFDGLLRGFAKDTGALLFEKQLRGTGEATVHLFSQSPGFFDYRYDLNPTPEPTTLLLLVSGMAAFGVGRRRHAG